MARTRAPGRLHHVLDAALAVFIASGYRRTRMADVAAAADVSPGLLYTYVAGKEALFQLVLQRELGVDVDAIALPVPNPDPNEIEALVRRALRDVASIDALTAATKTEQPADARAELSAIIGEHYDTVQRYRRYIKLVERSALDWPALSERFHDGGRRPFIRRLAGYIEQRVESGHFASVPDSQVAARYVIETVAWFANHRYGDQDGSQISDEVARATVIELVTRSFVGR